MSQKKVAVFIGRFQPFHNGHLNIIQKAISEFDQLIILVGSANRRISIKNPFSAEVRTTLIEEVLAETNPGAPVMIAPINDYLYNDTKWETQVYYTVHNLLSGDTDDQAISIVGFEKDDSSYYLRSFPQWSLVEYQMQIEINSTDIRKALFNLKEMYEPTPTSRNDNVAYQFDIYGGMVKQYTPAPVQKLLLDTNRLYKEFGLDDLFAEDQFYKTEAMKFADYPYPETLKFMCADVAVVCKGHILLIQRKFAPGRNTWALPGGFVNTKETFEQTAIRELIEETSIKVPARALEGKVKAASQSIKSAKMFDNPARTLGIARVSMAYFIEVEADPNGRLPRVKASDDAQDAQWIPLAKAKGMKLFDDHSDIIDYFTGSL